MKKISIMLMLTCALTAAAGNLKGVDRSNLDLSVAPGENFYRYACGGWQKANPLDPQYARFGTFDQLAENSREQVKDIITHLGVNNKKGTIEQQVGDLYALGMDSARLNREGNAPLQEPMASMRAATTRADVMKLIAKMHMGLSDPFFNSTVMADLKNSEQNMLYLMQGGLGMGDRDYYLEQDANTVKVRKAYADYVQRVLTLAGYKKGKAKKAAATVMNIETQLAQVAMTREESRDYSKLYNVVTLDELKSRYPNMDWDTYLGALQLKDVDKVCVFQFASLEKVNQLLATLKPQEIQDYLIFKYVDAAAPYLSDDFQQAHFDMYSRAMSGKQVMQPRWKRALNVPNTLLGEAVGQLYVKKYFPAESKRKMQQLVDNLRVALGEHIAGLSWMSPATKVNALVKLNSFTVKIGYPDKWQDYSGLNINNDSYWENVVRAKTFNAAYDYGQLGKPVDKERWWMTPQTVNAYYEPSSNEICFPAAILQPPYFDPTADDASNYGAIGVVIGHEMTHGFDDQGRNFDHQGNMVDWWTADDAAQFKALADKLGAQYSAEIVADDVHANGVFTMGENIADHGGLRVSYSAFKKTEQGKGNELIDGFTPDQRFFLSYANVWATNITKEEILRRTKVDPHSLGVNRVNVAIRNLEPFFKAFDIKEGDKMYRSEQDRVTIW
ncbi:MAG: M13 family metallopeptidase [Muribaculaceae bacterium]|nr:M13 family metallopeptidase [Muribaculaceae bacterium]